MVNLFPKPSNTIFPEIEITSSSEYDDLSVVAIIETFSPNAGVILILVIKIPNSAKISN